MKYIILRYSILVQHSVVYSSIVWYTKLSYILSYYVMLGSVGEFMVRSFGESVVKSIMLVAPNREIRWQLIQGAKSPSFPRPAGLGEDG